TTPPEKHKTYRARPMKDNPTIDADWNKPAWKGVEPLTLEYHMGEAPRHQPRVQARVAYDDRHIYIIWRAEDNYVLARRTKHQQSIWRDSCVEFFFTPGGASEKAGYFNIEANCIGKMLFAAHGPGGKDSRVSQQDLATLA